MPTYAFSPLQKLENVVACLCQRHEFDVFAIAHVELMTATSQQSAPGSLTLWGWLCLLAKVGRIGMFRMSQGRENNN